MALSNAKRQGSICSLLNINTLLGKDQKMRLSDLETCSLDETVIPSASEVNPSLPQNIVSRVATKVKQYVAPRSATRAANAGVSKLADEANQLMKEYLTWLHSSNVQPTLQNIQDWLTYKKLPIGPKSKELIKKIESDDVVKKSSVGTPVTPIPEARTTKAQQLKDLRNTIVLSSDMVSELITQVVSEKNLATFGASTNLPRSSSQQATPATANLGRSRGRSSTGAVTAPVMTIDSVANFYRTLKLDERQALRQQLDAIDATPPQTTKKSRKAKQQVTPESLSESVLTPQQVTQITTALTAAGIAPDSIGNVLSNLGGPAAGTMAKTTAKADPNVGNKTIKPAGAKSSTAPGSSTLGTSSGAGSTTLGSQGVAEESLDELMQLAGVSKEG